MRNGKVRLEDLLLEDLVPSKNLRTEKRPDVSELVDSIREHGLLQPIRVRPLGGGRFQIIAGRRRFEAHRKLGLKTISAIVVKESDESAAAQSIVENLQREDLTPLELARCVQELASAFQFKIEDISKLISKSPDRIRTWVRLSNLPDDVLEKLQSGEGRTQGGTALTPRHVEPFVRNLPSQEETRRNKVASAEYEKTLKKVRELQNEVQSRGVRINAHMADAIARETRQGGVGVRAAIDKVLADPDRYRYKPMPTADKLESDTFAAYQEKHRALISIATKLKEEIAISFSGDKRRILLERLSSLEKTLDPYRKALMSGRGSSQREPARLPKKVGNS